MNTPICDFVSGYAAADPVRLHMPGHKGTGAAERLDITEIPGADVLYHPAGIILESERNAARLFGARRTVYSAEGSSLSIRAMVYMAVQYALRRGKRPRIAAGRNAHKVFITAAALYMQQNNLQNANVRFDVIELTPDRINHIQNAFDATDLY
mgnify:CR=1 FL=1